MDQKKIFKGIALFALSIFMASCTVGITLNFAPTIAINEPGNFDVVGTNFTVTGAVKDSETIIKGVYISVNDGVDVIVPGTTNLSKSEMHYWSYEVVGVPIGVCKIEVYSEDMEGVANLSPRTRKLYVPQMESGVNEIKGTGNTIGTNYAFYGSLISGDDDDWYRIEVPVVGTYYVETMPSPYSTDVVDTVIELWDPTGISRITWNDDSGEGGYSYLSFSASAPGSYLLRVNASGSSEGYYAFLL